MISIIQDLVIEVSTSWIELFVNCIIMDNTFRITEAIDISKQTVNNIAGNIVNRFRLIKNRRQDFSISSPENNENNDCRKLFSTLYQNAVLVYWNW